MKVLYFGAPHCGMCRVLCSRVEGWCEKKDVPFVFYDADADENAELLVKYGIRSIPSVVMVQASRIDIIRGIDGWNEFTKGE